ncbi:MAG TPA: NAD(P)-dependent oxidoreductase [Patescibacteria group bacterium]|jgi:dTDP-4-dehydrorhamnose reductase|nr:NAD(P)-dependent oxidoreductase [Patescibacteria group bacterium]
MTRKMLVVGKDGTLGSEFVRALTDNELYDSTFTGRSDLDITNQEAVDRFIAEGLFDVIINCVAYNQVDLAENDPAPALDVNRDGVRNLAQAAEKIGATFVNFSTNYVFDGTDELGYTESDAPHPINEYGRSKLWGEYEAFTACSRVYNIRTFGLFGRPGIGQTSKKNFIDQMILRAANQNEVVAPNDQFGNPTYTADLVDATMDLLGSDEGWCFSTYHLVNEGGAVSRYVLAEEVYKQLGISTPLRAVTAESLGEVASRPKHGILLNTDGPSMPHWKDALARYLGEVKIE